VSNFVHQMSTASNHKGPACTFEQVFDLRAQVSIIRVGLSGKLTAGTNTRASSDNQVHFAGENRLSPSDTGMKSHFRRMLLSQLGKEESQKRAQRLSHRKMSSKEVARKTILVIDDEPSSLELATYILTNDGFQVLTAASAKEGKDFLQAGSDICMVITDLRMPGEDGFTVLTFLKENLRFHNIPAIVFTSCSYGAVVTRAIKFGAVDYLAKPFNAESLLARVHRTLERSKGVVLLVTDNELQKEMLLRDLQTGGFQVVTATTGAAASALLKTSQFRLVISELALHDMTGLDLMLSAQEFSPGLPFLFLSDPGMRITDNDIRAAGGFGLIERPLSNVDVLRKVRAVRCR
jgi:DNA-binding response OmpR family regulator